MQIDFDEASYEWRKNKIKLNNGSYTYCCGIEVHGKICKNIPSRRNEFKSWSLCDDHKEIYCLHDKCLESTEIYRSYYDLNLHMIKDHRC